MAYKQAISSLWHRQCGVISIEIGFVLIPFFVSLLFIFEICRYVFLASSVDLVMAQSARMASTITLANNYGRYFETQLRDRLNKWPLLFSKSKPIADGAIKCHIDFYSDVDAVINGVNQTSTSCNAGNVGERAENMPLALYQVEVRYQPLFAFLSAGSINRKLVFVQEFQRIPPEEDQ